MIPIYKHGQRTSLGGSLLTKNSVATLRCEKYISDRKKISQEENISESNIQTLLFVHMYAIHEYYIHVQCIRHIILAGTCIS